MRKEESGWSSGISLLNRELSNVAKGASLVVVDRGYLRIQREWRNYAAQRIDCPLIQVESDVIVPVEEASPKEEYAAATIRPKISKKLEPFLVPTEGNATRVTILSLSILIPSTSRIWMRAISKLRMDRSVKRVNVSMGARKRPRRHLQIFLEDKLDRYPELRNDPTLDSLSNMSPYLHFGQISPLYIALKALETEEPRARRPFLKN